VDRRTAAPPLVADDTAQPRSRVRLLTAAGAVAVLVVPVVVVLVLRRDDWLLTSDSVAQQSVVRTWFAAGHRLTYLPPDTWVLKLPLYAVVETLPLAPATRVCVEAVALAVLMVALAAWACRVLARQLTPAGEPLAARPLELVLPFAWLATLGGGIGSYLVALPNSRNIELGLALLVVALAGTRFPLPRRPVLLCVGAGSVVLLAALWVDDPYVAYLVGAPLAFAAAAWWLRSAAHGGGERRLLVVAAVLVASLVLIGPLRGLLARVGVLVVPDATGPTFDPVVVLGHLPILGPAAAAQLGLAEPGAAATIMHVLAVTLVALGGVAAVLIAVRGWRDGRVALFVLGVHPLVVVAGVLVNRTIYDFHAGRYLVLGFVDLAACLALAPAALRTTFPRHIDGRRAAARAAATWLVALTGVAVVAGLVSAALDRPVPVDLLAAERQEQAATLGLLEAAAAQGASTGLAPFWGADLYTHLSSGRVQISDVDCDAGRLRHRQWLTDTARLAARGPRTFVLLTPTPELRGPELPGCTEQKVIQQLGRRPISRSSTPGGAVLLVFDVDVTGKVLPATTPS
jgi:hypothetical protein